MNRITWIPLTIILLSAVGSAQQFDQARAWVHRSGEDGFFNFQTSFQSFAVFQPEQRWRAGDFDGDGKDDLVNLYQHETGVTRAWIHRSTGTAFEYQSSIDSLSYFWATHRWLVGDVDGDEKDDLVEIFGAGPQNDMTARIRVHRSTGSGFNLQTNSQAFAGYWAAQKWLVGDFNGDGKADLVNIYGAKSANGTIVARAWVHHSNGSGFEYQSSFQTFAGFWASQRWMTGDFNGDGKDDLLNVYEAKQPNGQIRARAWVHRSTGTGFEYRSSLQTLREISSGQRWLTGDFNGDDRDDLVVVFGFGPADSLRARAGVYLAAASGFSTTEHVSDFAGFWSSQKWIVGDFNGAEGPGKVEKADLVNIYGGVWPSGPDQPAPPSAPAPTPPGDGGTDYIIRNSSGQVRYFYVNAQFKQTLDHGELVTGHIPCGATHVLQAREQMSTNLATVTWTLPLTGLCLQNPVVIGDQILF